MLEGKKTYIASLLAASGALYYFWFEGNIEKGYELLIAALGLAGLRNAIENK